MSASSVWIVINCDGASQKLKDNIDHGAFAETTALKAQLDSLSEKLKSVVSQSGGTLHIAIPDRIVLEVPATTAEELPNILEGYKNFFGTLMAVGMGLSFSEAATASLKSVHTNETELFDPSDESFQIYKNSEDDGADLFLPPNLFDPLTPKKVEKPSDDKYVAPPDIKQQMQAEAEYLQGMIESMGGGQPQQPQQQPQAEQQPRDLLEALHGKQIEGREDPNQQEQSQSEEAAPEQEAGAEAEADDGGNENLARLLGTVKAQIPQIMQLAESNPDAFKQTMNLVHKLLAATKQRQKKTAKSEKSELYGIVEELNKKFIYPVGTRKGRRIKVMVNGRATWRSVISGQLKDAKGNPISVRSSNAMADDGSESIEKNTDLKKKILVEKTGLSKSEEAKTLNFVTHQTGYPAYDDMLKDPEYFKEKKGKIFSIVKMHPEEYINEAAKYFHKQNKGTEYEGKTLQEVKDTLINQRKNNTESISNIKNFKEVYMPILDYSNEGSLYQEGLHRSIVARDYGMKEIPVLVVKGSKNPSTKE